MLPGSAGRIINQERVKRHREEMNTSESGGRARESAGGTCTQERKRKKSVFSCLRSPAGLKSKRVKVYEVGGASGCFLLPD